MSETKAISVETISEAIEDAAKEYGAALKTWYPQHGYNAPAERNLTLHFAFALKGSVPGTRVYAESSLVETSTEESSERIDLVAYEPSAKSLVVVEAKRFLEKSPGGFADDVDRIGRFVLKNDNTEITAKKKFGVLLTQTIQPPNVKWWTEPHRSKKGPAWDSLAAHLAKVAAQGGVCRSAEVHEWEDPSNRQWKRHVLWCVWPCPLT